jgi:SAM-dependent methyltransferase
MRGVMTIDRTTQDRLAHWEQLYTQRAPTEVSWYQSDPARSVEWIKATGVPKDAPVIDVGGGASLLVDRLLDAGYTDVTVWELSGTALQRAHQRLGARAARVTWLQGDITQATLPRTYAVWHDRALFHFLTAPDDRRFYVETARRAVRPGGHLILATFSLAGPPRCSGLDVVRYAPQTLHEAFGRDLLVRQSADEMHRTPRGVEQAFVYIWLQMPAQDVS